MSDAVGNQPDTRESDEEGSSEAGMALRGQKCPDEEAKEDCPDA